MGGSNGKNQKPKPANKDSKKTKKAELSENDVQFLSGQSGLSKPEIKVLFDKFMLNNTEGKLSREQFVNLYKSLRCEDDERLHDISIFVFRAFDSNRDNNITFQEFLIAYALTSRGDLQKKLEYAFALYDADNNGYLDSNEVYEVIHGMLDLLGADRNENDIKQLADQCVKQLDTSRDGKISKEEFIDGLLKNYALRAMMSPFN